MVSSNFPCQNWLSYHFYLFLEVFVPMPCVAMFVLQFSTTRLVGIVDDSHHRCIVKTRWSQYRAVHAIFLSIIQPITSIREQKPSNQHRLDFDPTLSRQIDAYQISIRWSLLSEKQRKNGMIGMCIALFYQNLNPPNPPKPGAASASCCCSVCSWPELPMISSTPWSLNQELQ